MIFDDPIVYLGGNGFTIAREVVEEDPATGLDKPATGLSGEGFLAVEDGGAAVDGVTTAAVERAEKDGAYYAKLDGSVIDNSATLQALATADPEAVIYAALRLGTNYCVYHAVPLHRVRTA